MLDLALPLAVLVLGVLLMFAGVKHMRSQKEKDWSKRKRKHFPIGNGDKQ
jgi:hypothetical protein